MKKTHVFVILDRSGSMSAIKDDTIGGYNEYLKGLKDQEDIRWNLTIFDTEFDKLVDDMPIAEVPELDNKTFVPRGMTALIDATCQTLNEAESRVKRGDKALVVIITDGLENASRENTSDDMKKLVTRLTAKKNWTFTYLGANQDAWNTAKNWGFRSGNVASYNATSAGTRQAFGTAVGSTYSFVTQSASATTDFYTKDQDKLKNTK